jgi:hypothetical protein
MSAPAPSVEALLARARKPSEDALRLHPLYRDALALVGKDPGRVRVVMTGMGAANVARYRLLTANGVEPRAVVACDRHGILAGAPVYPAASLPRMATVCAGSGRRV